MKTRLSILVILASTVVVGVSVWSARLSRAQVDEDAIVADAAEPHAQESVLIGTLRGRGFAVHFYTDARYSIEGAGGEIVGVHLTESEFAEQFPELYGLTRDTFAAEPIADSLGYGDTMPLERSGRSP